jgi:hypothetical protein
MNLRYTLLLLAMLLGNHIKAQYETVLYDYAKNWFGENQSLPAEQQWMLTGALPETVNMVELEIYRSGNKLEQLLYRSNFQRPADGTMEQFSIPVNFKLRGSTAYDLRVLYFENASDADMRRLSQMVNDGLTAYLNQSVVAGRRQVELAKHPLLIKQELDQIVQDGLGLYRSRMGIDFTGFSDIVFDKLERMDDLRLKAARFNILKTEDQDEKQTRVAYFQQNIEELASLLEREVNQYLSGSFYVLREARRVANYKSEATRWTLPINVGYAAVYDNVTDDGFAVEGAPMVGFSFPLGNPNFSGNFWSNSALSFGALLQNITFNDRVEFDGPLIGTPLYVAYGYKTAYFLRINAGTAIMQEVGSNNIQFSPFIGLSVELNLWLGLSK